jgi:hypothetical protein
MNLNLIIDFFILLIKLELQSYDFVKPKRGCSLK